MIELPKRRLSGRAHRAVVKAVEQAPLRALIAKLARRDLGVDALYGLPARLRSGVPFDQAPLRARASHARPSAELGPPPQARLGHAALRAAYAAGKTSPESAVERAVAAARSFAELTPCRGGLVADDERRSAAARESRARLMDGPRSALEGVPVVIKEEVDVEGLATRVGSAWMPHVAATSDAIVVARLRRAGAIVLGHTAMTEYGMTPLGDNPFRNMPRNAHSATHLPGGSSSGTGVAVALGLAPVGLGTDSGGSIRTPAAFNGVFGLKPSYARLPATGDAFNGDGTLLHLGPIGATSHDLAVFTEITAGADEGDPASFAAPPLAPGELVAALGRGVAGLRIGVDEAEWAAADPAVARACRSALGALERAGARLVDVRLELARHAPALGYVTVGVETLVALREVFAEHGPELGDHLRVLLHTLSTFGPSDYLYAQSLRQTLRRQLATLLLDVDLYALPTTATTAPPIDDREAAQGFTDPHALAAACRYAFLGNLTGLPAGTAPVGLDAQGLPIGLQFIGDAWDEACVLQALAELERSGAASVEAPAARLDLTS